MSEAEAPVIEQPTAPEQPQAEQEFLRPTAKPEDGEPEAEAEGKSEKPARTPEQEKIAKLENALSRKRQQLADARARLTQPAQQAHNGPTDDDSEVLSLTRAQVREMALAEAKRLAPTVANQEALERSRGETARALRKEVGAERFEELTDGLAEVFSPAMQLHLLDISAPRAVLEYLHDNEDEAARIGAMPDLKAARELARIEDRIAAETAKAKAEAKAKRSNAATPIEGSRPAGGANGQPDPRNMKAWVEWANKQEAQH